MSVGDRIRQWLEARGGQTRRRAPPQAQPIGAVGHEPRPLQRAQWLALGIAALAAVALTAGLVYGILALTRPGAAPTPTAVAAATPSPSPLIVAVVSPSPGSVLLTPGLGLPRGERVQVANTGGEGANLRREPSTSAQRLRVLPEGTVVEVVGPDTDAEGRRWRNVRDLDGETGWLTSNFLVPEGSVAAVLTTPATGSEATAAPGLASTARPAAPAATAPGGAPAAKPTAARAQVGRTDGQGANIRSEPGTGGRVLKTAPEGAALDVLGPEREVEGRVWRQVRDAAGVTGWIVGGAIVPPGSVSTPAPRGAATSTPAPVPKPGAPTPTSTPSAVQTRPVPVPTATATPFG